MIRTGRFAATFDGDFVVFLIGMRINQPLKVHRWLPVASAMPRMIRELMQHPELGFIHAEAWFSRTVIMVQYWRSLDHLLAYATNKDAEHLPAWRDFNRSAGRDGSVGVWHETYSVGAGRYENVYVNMPAFGLGRAGTLEPAVGSMESAAKRFRARTADAGDEASAATLSAAPRSHPPA
jgi:hypothetical protein